MKGANTGNGIGDPNLVDPNPSQKIFTAIVKFTDILVILDRRIRQLEESVKEINWGIERIKNGQK